MNIEQFIVGSMQVCCYLLACEKTGEALVIDPGGGEERILARVQEQRLKLRFIVNTHAHPDHVCGNGPIQKASAAKIVMHEKEADFYADPGVRRYFALALDLAESPPADVKVTDGDFISFGEERLLVIHTPGHSPGGMCLYSAPNCFTGDTLFVGAVGRSDLLGGSEQTLKESVTQKLFTLPQETVVWPGHAYDGRKTTLGRARQHRFFF